MKTILLFLLLSPILAQAQTRVTTNEISTTTAWNFPATAPVTISSLTTKGDTLFDSETSTVSVHGWIDIGYEPGLSYCPASASIVDIYCPAGKKQMGGGGYCNNGATAKLYDTPLLTDKGWRVACAGATNNCVFVNCARIK